MKEYKVVMPKLGFRNRVQKYEDLLNQYAREGWLVKHIGQTSPLIIFERDKKQISMSNRPKIKVPLETTDLVLEVINIAFLLFICLYVLINYNGLPETIPMHFNAKGEADDFGNKAILWILPAISAFIFTLIFIISKYPHIHNYMVNITEENALKNYKLSNRLLRFSNLYCMILLAVIVYEIVQLAKGFDPNVLGIPFLIFSLIVPFIGIAFIFYYQKKINQ